MILAHAKDYWRNRHMSRQGDEWAEMYWASAERPYRDRIVELVRHEAPIASVLELGCNALPNLRRMHSAFPEAELYGVDVNDAALAYGFAQARKEGWDLKLALETDTLERYIDRHSAESFDVVFSCYALAYVEPSVIKSVVRGALRLARKLVIFAEPSVAGAACRVRDADTDEWAYDYLRMASQLRSRPASISEEVVPSGFDALNKITCVVFEGEGGDR